MTNPRVLYITGMTRCGSTMLGNVLNEVPGVVHIGELHYLWRNGVLRAGTNTSCGCGEEVTSCPLWSRVLGNGHVPAGTDVARRIVAAQRGHLRTAHTPFRLAESRRGTTVPAEVDLAIGAMTAVYRELATGPDTQLIVDSSKYPAEAAALLGRTDADVRVLHMVRDPRATAFSYRSGKSYIDDMNPALATARWSAINLASDLLGVAAGGRYLRVRHEDFGADPRGVLDRVLRFAGVTLDDAGDNPVDDEGGVRLGDNHTVTGNPDRLNRGRTVIRCDERWRTELTRGPRAIATTGAGVGLYRYGYAGRPHRGMRPELAGRSA